MNSLANLGSRVFTADDQQRFAAYSLDRNPMHMDAVAARRLITGRQVVHGIHVLLHALERWSNESARRPASVDCTFANPISVGDEVVFSQSERDDGLVAIEASVNALSCARILIGFAAPPPPPHAEAAAQSLAPRDSALDNAPTAHAGQHYRLALPQSEIAQAFPRCAGYFGAAGVAAIATLSYFVGMICPGLHSIFSSLSFGLDGARAQAAALDFHVRKYDERVRLFDIAFDGAIYGGIKAFLRAPPQEQPSVTALAQHVAPDEFRGRSLVIGGSRGLGELTAKLLAAGGGDVVVSYAAGLRDAQQIQADINAHRAGACDLLQLDLTRADFATMDFDWAALDAVYFFATPRIYRKKNDVYDAATFAEFVDFYASKFYDLCRCLEARAGGKKIKVFFPSSVFVTERPKGMTEYAMAKAAGEVLVDDINRSFKNVSVLSTRLPRLSTDQTASILKVSTESNLDTLLPVVRAFMRGA